MKRKHKAEVHKENGERWLLTYSDLITLLMIFFVVMYSMSSVDAAKFQAVAESLNNALGGGIPAKIDISDKVNGPSMLTSGMPSNTGLTNVPQDQQIKNTIDGLKSAGEKAAQAQAAKELQTIMGVKNKLDKFAAENGFETKIVSSIEERGLVVSIQETILYKSGSADVMPFAHEILGKISVVLSSVPNYIKVEGHTCTIPIRTIQFPSNWELSVIRATNVLQILTTEGHINPYRLSAVGYGEYRPIASNATEAGRIKNRRVDLIILRSKYEVTEPNQTVKP
jgi:chemotaxis protein MotB